MARRSISLMMALTGLSIAQSPGTSPEIHPKLLTYTCTKAKGCIPQTSALVIDSLSHWVHQRDAASLGCGDWGNPPNSTVCPDIETCQENCIMEGVSDYSIYGVTTNGSNLHMKHLRDDGSVASPRLYLLAESEDRYELLKLTGKELTFNVDVSKLPCGMNGALYLSEMAEDGGQSPLNTGGAAYGTGYCDAQCFTTPFINGVGNLAGNGACCNEMDIWEANARATQIAPHTCNQTGLYECSGDECAFGGVCDKNGCGYNPYVLGNKEYYGFDFTVDTSRPFTVVTQFPTDENGELKEIRRLYVQSGIIIANAAVNVTGPQTGDSTDNEYCAATGATRFLELGGHPGMGQALERGMVLIFSIWWDEGGYMNWLDSGNAGPCNATEGAPTVIRQIQPDTDVTFSEIKWGEIDSTYGSPTKCKKRTVH